MFSSLFDCRILEERISHLVSPVQSSGGVPALGKQKAVAAGRADAMNRRAPLGDIGNFVAVRATEGYQRNQARCFISHCFLARSSSENELHSWLQEAAGAGQPPRHEKLRCSTCQERAGECRRNQGTQSRTLVLRFFLQEKE